MDTKEGGKSQFDVGGKNSHRLSPIYYTSIAEIKGFRFRLENINPTSEKSSRERDIKSQAGPAPIRSVLQEEPFTAK